MEDQSPRSQVASLRADFRSRVAPSDERPAVSDELAHEADSDDSGQSTPSRRRKQATTANEFNGSLVPVQFKLPADLVQSLKLHSIANTETMSEIVLRCLTTGDVITKAWINTRKAS